MYGKHQILFPEDSIVIKKYISGIEGGRTLDVAGYPVANVFAGSPIIKKDEVYMPMPLKENGTNEDGSKKYAYAALPEGAEYVGVCYRSLSVTDGECSIMFDGIVNEAILPYDFATIKEAFAKACPHIIFQQDEEA